jgi:hypothetical protein
MTIGTMTLSISKRDTLHHKNALPGITRKFYTQLNIMQCVIYAERRNEDHSVECRYTECRGAFHLHLKEKKSF